MNDLQKIAFLKSNYGKIHWRQWIIEKERLKALRSKAVNRDKNKSKIKD